VILRPEDPSQAKARHHFCRCAFWLNSASLDRDFDREQHLIAGEIQSREGWLRLVVSPHGNLALQFGPWVQNDRHFWIGRGEQSFAVHKQHRQGLPLWIPLQGFDNKLWSCENWKQCSFCTFMVLECEMKDIGLSSEAGNRRVARRMSQSVDSCVSELFAHTSLKSRLE